MINLEEESPKRKTLRDHLDEHVDNKIQYWEASSEKSMTRKLTEVGEDHMVTTAPDGVNVYTPLAAIQCIRFTPSKS